MRWSISLLLFLFNIKTLLAISKPRGVPLSKLPFYKVDEPFSCLDGSQTNLPWYKVNDDYCDCHDGSDEPGTSACGNGFFFCENKNHQAKLVPSSRVNDGICDCCDGSDEYDAKVACKNTCWELGKAFREAVEEKKRLLQEGLTVYEAIIKDVAARIAAKKSRLEAIEEEINQATEAKRTAEDAKDAAEIPEKEALDKHNKVFDEVKNAWQERHDNRKITSAFNILDLNNDKLISLEELQSRKEFDVDQSGEVSEQEAKDYLAEENSANFDHFKEKVWNNIKDVFKFAPKDKDEKDLPEDESTSDENGLKSETPSDSDFDENDPEPKQEEQDEETKALVQAATEARKVFDDASEKLRNLENEKKDINTILERDYGKDSAFFSLADSNDCFEMTDREYIYKLCPFRDATQRSRDSSSYSSTVLGRWSKWNGNVQVYDNGQGCWNGPNRSVKVHVFCGPENKLTKVEEPSRCEYSMDFITPAACSEAAADIEKHNLENHDEL